MSDLQQQRLMLQANADKAAAELKAKIEERDALSVAAAIGEKGAQAKYEKCELEVLTINGRVHLYDTALKSVEARIAEELRNREREGRAQLVSDIKRVANQRRKAADKIQAAIGELASGWSALFGANSKLQTLIPVGLQIGGTLTRDSELIDMAELELRRAHPVEATLHSVVPPLPGANSNAFISARKLPEFAAAIEMANNHLISIVEN